MDLNELDLVYPERGHEKVIFLIFEVRGTAQKTPILNPHLYRYQWALNIEKINSLDLFSFYEGGKKQQSDAK